jgi:alpha-tubulin suppressor-like RCC1 family protein
MVGRAPEGNGRNTTIARRGLLFSAVLAACSSASADDRPPPPHDGGDEDAAVGDGRTCGTGDVWCGGSCVQETVAACGDSCIACGAPAASHGTADCVDGSCTLVCDGGYSQCGKSGCCGDATSGDVRAIAVGGSTTCGLTLGGAASCWGDGSYGTLGNGQIQVQTPTPVGVLGLDSQVASLSLGDRHACAVTTKGDVSCWGDDQQGQLGDGGRTPRSQPVTPQGLGRLGAAVTSVAAGGAHTCAVTSAGGAKCWGDNSYGQLGNGTTSVSLVPSDVQGLTSGVTLVATGERFTCALLTAGGVKCWGDGSSGQLGKSSSSSKPVDIALAAPAKAIAAGGRHACAITQQGLLYCWGADDSRQLGDAHVVFAQPIPQRVSGAGLVVAVSAGGDETCAVDAMGGVHCWGIDPVGDAGPGPADPSSVPSLYGGVASIGVVAGHACAVMTGGAAKCWGVNGAGELGDATTTASWVPVDVQGI